MNDEQDDDEAPDDAEKKPEPRFRWPAAIGIEAPGADTRLIEGRREPSQD